jgi:chorismate mutase
LWIGARTTVNPFAVQEKWRTAGTDKIVLLKSSKPRFVLVVSGVERLYNAGIEN